MDSDGGYHCNSIGRYWRRWYPHKSLHWIFSSPEIVFLVAVVRSSRKTKLQDLRLWICGGKGWWILDTNRWEEWSGWFWCSLGNYQVVVDFHLCLAVDDASSWDIIRMGWNWQNCTQHHHLQKIAFHELFDIIWQSHRKADCESLELRTKEWSFERMTYIISSVDHPSRQT